MVEKCRLGTWLLVAAVSLPLFCTINAFGSDDDLRADLVKAQREIQELREALAELKSSSAWQYRQELGEALGEMPSTAKDEAAGQIILPAGWTIKPYGYIKMDMIYDDSQTIGGGDVCFAALPENSTTRSDDQTSFTARQTRLGAIIAAPDITDIKVKGVVETDFYGTSGTGQRENISPLRMRRAFGQLTGADWSFLFGQEWEILSPLFPNTLNFAYGAAQGNTGFRQPQLRFDKWWTCPNDGKFMVQTALQREINFQGPVGAFDNGLDASRPSVLGRLSYSAPSPLDEKNRYEFGVSGHIGEEEVDATFPGAVARAGEDQDVHSWSVVGDWIFPLSSQLEIRGEWWWAENMDSHDGGIWQGINPTTGQEIEAVGGWIQLAYMPTEEWNFNIGTLVDDPIDSDVDDGMRSQNTVYFGNVMYNFSKYLTAGLEVSYFYTDYDGARINGFRDGDVMRFQHSWILKF